MKEMVLKIFIFSFFYLSLLQLNGQEQMKMMHYNLLFYGNPFACDESNNNTDEKDVNLAIILDEIQPDVFTVNELSSDETYADRILNQVLNIGIIPEWSRAISTNTSWDSGIVNMLYYNHGKYNLYDQQVASQSPSGTNLIRVVDMYTLYENISAASGDTIFFNVLVAHLSASDEDMRLQQCQAAMEMVESNGPGNYIFSGDLNIDSSNEDSFQELINNDLSTNNFYDPADALGTWHNNSSFSELHTQSTRVNGGGCHAGGGMDDRFDFTLLTNEVMTGINGLSYIADSYVVFGNDGDNFDQPLHVSNNTVVSSSVAIALYTVSDHLPIVTSYEFDINVGITERENSQDFDLTLINSQLNLLIPKTDNYLVSIFDSQGRLVKRETRFDRYFQLNLSKFNSSLYFISVLNLTDQSHFSQAFILTN